GALILQGDHIALADVESIELFGPHVRVRPFRDHDRVLAIGTYVDRCESGGLPLEVPNATNVDTECLKVSNVARPVSANRSDHLRIGTGSRGCYGQIAARVARS